MARRWLRSSSIRTKQMIDWLSNPFSYLLHHRLPLTQFFVLMVWNSPGNCRSEKKTQKVIFFFLCSEDLDFRSKKKKKSPRRGYTHILASNNTANSYLHKWHVSLLMFHPPSLHILYLGTCSLQKFLRVIYFFFFLAILFSQVLTRRIAGLSDQKWRYYTSSTMILWFAVPLLRLLNIFLIR